MRLPVVFSAKSADIPDTIRALRDEDFIKAEFSYMLSGGLGGAGATGGGYLQTIVITSSPSISNPG